MQITIDTNNLGRRDMRLLSLVLDLVAEEVKQAATQNTGAQLHPNDHPSIGGEVVNTATMFAGNAPQGATSVVDTAAMFGNGSGSTAAPAPVAPGPSHGVAPQIQQVAPAVQQVAAPVGAVERDSEGYPWDERIHSSSKKKTDGGAWILKKGINNDKAKLNRVKAELMQTMPLAAGAPVQQTNPAPVFQQAPQQQVNPVAAAPMQQPATLQGQMVQAGMIPPPPQAQPDPTTMPELMARVGPLMASGQLAPTALNQVVEQLGLPNLMALATTHAAMVPTVWALLKR